MRPLIALIPACLALLSCGGDPDLPPLVGVTSPNQEYAEALFHQAKQAEQNGSTTKAIKLYDRVADEAPLSTRAPEARFRQAELLEQSGETRKAFDTYEEFLGRYNASPLYGSAIQRQANLAQAAADGKIKTSFLGIKSKLSAGKIVEMLGKVRSNSPRTPAAAKAQFAIGEIWENEKSRDASVRAIEAYRTVTIDYADSPQAPEAQFRIGNILLNEARRGNHDQANLDRARNAFEDYLRLYPGHHRNKEARQLLANLGGQDLQRSLGIAKFYESKGDTASARFYYQEVVRKTKSGPIHDEAQARLTALGN